MRKLLFVAAAAAAMSLAACATVRNESSPEIAITVDDLPVHAPYPPGLTPNAVNAQMVAALAAARVPATGFLNGVGVEQHPETMQALEQWRRAGLVVGNHTWSHRRLSEMSLQEFETELTRNEPILGQIGNGTDWHWFRYPFLDEGENSAKRIAARQVLARRGYRAAAVTIGFGDWEWTGPYARCAASGDAAAIAELERLYLVAAAENIAVTRETAHRLYGRDIPYVLLMHVSALSAHMMPRLIELYRHAGFSFVSLAEAESDETYRAYTDLALAPPQGPNELAAARGVTLPSGTDYSAKLSAICPEGRTATNR